MTTGQKIARGLFTNGAGQRAQRLLMIGTEKSRDLGGWSEKAVAWQTDQALRGEWPEEHRTRFSVFVLPSGEGELRGYSGRADDDGGFDATLDDLFELAAEALPRGTTSGYYLLEVEPGKNGSDDRAVIVARETEDERAERLTREAQHA